LADPQAKLRVAGNWLLERFLSGSLAGAHRAGLAQRQSNGFVTCNTPGNIPPFTVKLQGHRISQCSPKCRKHWGFSHLARLFPVAALRAFEHGDLLGNCWAFLPHPIASTSTQMCPFHGQKCGFCPKFRIFGKRFSCNGQICVPVNARKLLQFPGKAPPPTQAVCTRL
jgi:hypothetical protein